MATRKLKGFQSLYPFLHSLVTIRKSESDLLRQQEVGEHLEPSHGVQVSVELHQGLGLVIGQPDGGDALKQRNMVIVKERNQTHC